MFKEKVIKGLIYLLVMGVLASTGWAIGKKPVVSEQQAASSEQKGVVKQAEVKENPEASEPESEPVKEGKKEPEVNRIVREIIEDFEKQMVDLFKTYREKTKPIMDREESLFKRMREISDSYKKSLDKLSEADRNEYLRLNEEIGNLEAELYQLGLWKDKQERLLIQKKERREEEMAKKYLENYVKKEIIFIPKASGMDVDKDGNVYIWDGKNSQVFKYVKEKVKGKEHEEKYKKVLTIHFSEVLYGKEKLPFSKVEYDKEEEKDKWVIPSIEINKEPILIERFRSSYRYEFIKRKEPTPFAYRCSGEKEWRIGIKILDASNNKVLGEILFKENYTRPLAIDRGGNVYLLIDDTLVGCLGPDEWRLEVHKYSKEGNLLTKIKLPLELEQKSRVGQRMNIEVDKDGNIYQFLSKEDGCHMLKWELRQNNED